MSRISRMAIRSIRTHYVSYKLHCIPSRTVRTKRTVRKPEQSEKLPFGYTSRRISHSSPHFLITMKNGIHVDQRNRNDCSRHGASSMCSNSPWNWRRRRRRKKKKEKKREEEARRRVQVKRRKKWRIGWKEESNWATTGLFYTNWRKKLLPASRITSEWTQIHLMRFWRELHPE